MQAKQQKPTTPRRRRPRRQTGPTESRRPSDDADAFFRVPDDGPIRAPDALAEQFAEDYLQAATTGEDQSEDLMDATVSEEIGGPFIETSATREMALTSDETNPLDAMAEPLPRAVAGLVTTPSLDEELDALESGDEDEQDAVEDREDDLRAESETPTPPHTH